MLRTIVITGASSGIGRALALAYAGAGALVGADGSAPARQAPAAEGLRLGLLGRDGARLEAVAAACRAAGAEVEPALIDVRDRGAMAAWLEQFDDAAPVDLLIANAGVMEGTRPDGAIEPAQTSYELMQTNVLGLLNTVQPLLPRMMARRRGQIAIVSSLAGLIPLRDSPSYCASKAAALAYGLSLRDLLGATGIGVSVICPGYVTTPMSQREIGEKPHEMPPEQAAEIIRRGLARNKAVIAFPFWFAMATRIGSLLPDWLRERVTRASRFRVR